MPCPKLFTERVAAWPASEARCTLSRNRFWSEVFVLKGRSPVSILNRICDLKFLLLASELRLELCPHRLPETPFPAGSVGRA